jgi:hypothetical protein
MIEIGLLIDSKNWVQLQHSVYGAERAMQRLDSLKSDKQDTTGVESAWWQGQTELERWQLLDARQETGKGGPSLRLAGTN